MYQIEELKKIKDTDGKSAYQYGFPGDEWDVIYLAKGKTAGEHYHKGTSPLKNPEILVQISGKGQYYFKDLATGEEKSVIINSPKMVKIKANIYHKVEAKALEDLVLLERHDESSDKFEL